MGNRYEDARVIAIRLLGETKEPTAELIAEKVRLALTVLGVTNGDVDASKLQLDLEASYDVWMRPGAALDGVEGEDHKDWLRDNNTLIEENRTPPEWLFWRQYKRYLLEVKRRPPHVIEALDRSTTDVLKRLEDPARVGPWDRRGMVVGQVQSGKTAHFTGLICKAADAGYKVIIVLTGLHNNLRSQTQLRLDEEFVGVESDKWLASQDRTNRIGVGKLFAERMPLAHTLTSSNDKGDFTMAHAAKTGVMAGGDPILLVVKKNARVLDTLNTWIRTLAQYDHERGVARRIPALIIDDECDQASINTKPQDYEGNPDYEVSAINAKVRHLLGAFEQKAYVGYTATPFASIFIHPSNPHSRYGDDLFPRSFIISLPTPSDYVGPVEVFGVEADPAGASAATEGWPLVARVSDHEAAVPDKHKKELVVANLPASVHTAIRSFILTCAARRKRGQANEHNSMLVHMSRFNLVQHQLHQLINDELRRLQDRIRFNDGAQPGTEGAIFAELRAQWDNQFVPTIGTMRMVPRPESWEEILPHVVPAAEKIVVREINNSVQDVLEYRQHKEGLSVIVIGGDKLSRGLTLEGLSTSYYLRAANAYDTLMQMGRWFGYRPNYADLCRVFTTNELVNLYRWIAMATEELRRDFNRMAATNQTPLDFGLRVKMHPGGLLITSLNKMGTGERMPFSFADHMVQTIVLGLDRATLDHNRRVTEDLVRRLGKPGTAAKDTDVALVWNNVPPDAITSFISAYRTHPQNPPEVNSALLAEYISAQNRRGGLTEWTVAVLHKGDAGEAPLGGHTVNMARRRGNVTLGPTPYVSLNGLTSPVHEALDLSKAEWNRAKDDSKNEWEREQAAGTGRRRSKEPPTTPYPGQIRALRPRSRGLLLLYPVDAKESQWGDDVTNPVTGYGISFPPTRLDDTPVTYLVNARFQDEVQ